MRRLNVKFLLYLVLAGVLLSGAVILVHELQAGNISSALLWQASQAEKQGQLKVAARYLRRYLEFAKNDMEERAHLGMLLSDPKLAITPRARERARFVIEAVLTKEPDRHELRKALTRMGLAGWDLDLAKVQLRYLQKALPKDGEVIGLSAHLQEKQGQTEQALQTYRKALEKAPQRPEYAVRLVMLLLDRERKQPGSQKVEITRLVAAALRQAPEDTGVCMAASEWAFFQADAAAARRYLEAGLKVHPDDPRLYQALAGLVVRTGKREEAVRVVKRGLEAAAPEERYELLWTLANLHIDGGEVAEARQAVGRIRDEVGPTPMIDYLEARCLMVQQRWLEAATSFERVRGAVRSSPDLALQVNLFLGKCYEQLNEPGQQLAAFTRALAQDASSQEARAGVAAAQWALGQPEAAIEHYREIVKLQGAGRAGGRRLDLARLLLVSNRQKDAKRWRQVEEELDAAEKESPGSVAVTLLRADLRMAQDQPAQAEQVIREAVQRQPKQIDLWRALVALLQRRDNLTGARQALEDAARQLGDGVDLRLTRAQFWGGRPKDEAGPALAQLETGAEKFSAEDQARLLSGLAEAQYAIGDVPHAVALWEKLAAQPEQASNLRLRMLLFEVALQQGDDPAMQRLIGEVKRLDAGDGVTWRYAEAARLLWLARKGQKEALAQAQPLLDSVVAKRPAWAPGLVARAELEDLRGRPDEAIARYRQALDRGVRDPRVVRQLVQILSTQQRYGEAEQLLKQLGQQAPLSADLQRMAVALSLQNDNYARAEELVRQAAPAGSGDYRDQLWLGQVLATGNRVSPEAEKALRRAVELADTVPVTWVALVEYLTDAEKLPQAKVEIEKARRKLAPADAPLALGQCYEMVGVLDKAREQYQAALKARGNEMAVHRTVAAFYLRTGAWKEAETQLRQIMEGKPKASADDVTWARQTLALVLASGFGAPRLPEAAALVGLRLDEHGAVADGLAPGAVTGRAEDVARARVLATQGRRSFQTRAIALLEGAGKEQVLLPDDQFLLARLYLAFGDKDEVHWGKAREQLRILLAASGRNPAYLATYARSLLRHGATAEAEQIIDRLEQAEKGRQVPAGTFGSVELRAQALEAEGRGKQALTLLDGWARKPGAPPTRLLQCATLRGRLGEVTQALDLCEEASKSCSPEGVAATGIVILRATQPGEKRAAPGEVWRAQAGRVEGWLKAAIKAAPERARLRLQLADLLDLVGRGGEAEGVYRLVLKQDDRNPVALNNLAWLLTRQAGKQAEALKLINRAIELYGPQADLLDTRALVYLAMGQGSQAVTDLRRAVADAPGPTTYFHLIQAHQMARDTRSALAVLSQVNAAGGLSAEQLHPTERETYLRVIAELKQR
jgi:tetratricopeptide (TPR) repeat protein